MFWIRAGWAWAHRPARYPASCSCSSSCTSAANVGWNLPKRSSAVATRKVEQEIEALTRLRDVPAEEAQPALRKALGDRVNLIVAKAAKISAERQFQDLVPDLLQAFDRLMEKPVERDPQCW